MPLDDQDNPLAIEIRQEMATAYFAACRKMVDALEALKSFDRSIEVATPDSRQVSRTQLIEAAAERVYFVLIQRDAMKLSHYESFFEDYLIPDEVKSRVGATRPN